MKKKVGARVATLFLVWLVLAASRCVGQAEDYIVSATRTVTVHEGYVTVNDTFTLLPVSGRPEVFMIGCPKSLAGNLINSFIYPYAVSSGEKLTVEWPSATDEQFDWISVTLPTTSGSLKFSIFHAYSSLVSTTQFGERILVFPVVPALRTEINSCYTEIWFDESSIVNIVPPNYTKRTADDLTVLSARYERQPPRSNLSERFVFSSLRPTQYVVTQASRVIEISPFTGLTVTDGFKIRTEGYSSQTSIPVFLLGNASDVSVRDAIGDLLTESMSGTQRSMFRVSKPVNSSVTLVSIYPRYPLYPTQNYSFYISYHLPAQNVTGLSIFEKAISLRLPATTNFTSFANNFTLEVLLPAGAEIGDVKVDEFSLTNEPRASNSFETRIEGATKEVFESAITLTYRYDTFWAGYTPSIALSLSFLVGLVYTLTKPERVPEVYAPPIELEAVMRFVERHREKMRIQGRLERLRQDFRNRRITRQEFKTRRRPLSRRLEEVNRGIPQLKAQALKAGRAVTDLITEIEVSEAQIASMNSAIGGLDSQFSQRRISRAAYDKLLKNYLKRIRSEKTKIGAAENELGNLSRT